MNFTGEFDERPITVTVKDRKNIERSFGAKRFKKTRKKNSLARAARKRNR